MGIKIEISPRCIFETWIHAHSCGSELLLKLEGMWIGNLAKYQIS